MILRFTDGRPSLISCDVPDCGESVEFREPASLFEMRKIVLATDKAFWTTSTLFEGRRDYCPKHNPVVNFLGIEPCEGG